MGEVPVYSHVSKLKYESLNAESTAMNTMCADAVYEPNGFETIGENKPVEADFQGCSMSRFWESQHISSNVQMSVGGRSCRSHPL